MKRIFVIDGFATIFRSYYSFINNPLINSQGFNTSAIFGFVRSIFQIIKEFSPEYLVVAFEGKDNFRKKIYPEYKANRSKVPDDLLAQIPEILKLTTKMSVPSITIDGYEADDAIASIAYLCKDKNYECRIISSDKDLHQLVDEKIIQLVKPHRSNELIEYDIAKITDKFGIAPSQIADYLAIKGDSSDNIPGIKGIGDKGATKLLQEYGTLENIYAQIDNIKSPTIKKKLIASKEMAELSFKLVSLTTPPALPEDEEAFKFNGLDKEASREMFERFELVTLLNDDVFSGSTPQPTAPKTVMTTNYKLIDNKKEVDLLIEKLTVADQFAIDTETTDLDPYTSTLLGISFAFKAGEGFYLPIGHRENPIDKKMALQKIAPFLIDESKTKIGQNIKFDIKVLRANNIQISMPYFDTMIGALLTGDVSRGGLKIESLALKHLNRDMIHYEDIVPKDGTLDDIELEKVAEYSAEDAEIAFCLYERFLPKLKENEAEKLFSEIEMPLIDVLAGMELAGIKIDKLHFEKMDGEFVSILENLKTDIFSEAGEEFNVNSPKQLAEILFVKMGIAPEKKTKTGYSTNEKVLNKLAVKYPIAELLSHYRKMNKLQSGYIHALPQLLNTKTNKIHSNFNQTGTATGRLSSTNPNLQNIPNRSKEGKMVRAGFIASPGKKLISVDYSQIELRILAALSKDKELLRSYSEGADIHRRTASAIFNIPEEMVSDEQRNNAKTVNFGVIYGQGSFGLAEQLKISRGEATGFIEAYFSLYGDVQNFITETISKAEETGFVSTYYGRKRQVPELQSKSQRKFGERIAVNTIIQGTAADLIKIAMIELQKELIKIGKGTILLQIHDELIVEADESDVTEVEKTISKTMQEAWPFSNVPIEVSSGNGNNWAEAH